MVSNSQDKTDLYYFGWPSWYGGADTKAAHLFPLLKDHFNITVVPFRDSQLRQEVWTQFFHRHGIRYLRFDDLPERLDGIGLCFCYFAFFTEGRCAELKRRGLRVAFSSDMCYHVEGELEAIERGDIDLLLCVSDYQRKLLDYESVCDIPIRVTGNYVNHKGFPYAQRDSDALTIGRLSRADPLKFADDFPLRYEDLPAARFRVLAWNEKLQEKFAWHDFDDRWDLLAPQADTNAFLQTIDVFVYDLSHREKEAWGRSTVEAMLTGAIPVVPNDYHFPQLIKHGETGFLCDGFEDVRRHVQLLRRDRERRRRMSRACHQHAANNLCNRAQHKRIWCEALSI